MLLDTSGLLCLRHHEIDRLICEPSDLTADEIAIVEGRSGVSRYAVSNWTVS